MRIATYIMNWLIVCLCCCASAMFMLMFSELAHYLLDGQAIPIITGKLLNNKWILWVIPLGWGIVTGFFLYLKHSAEKLTFHISASVFLGLFVFFIYIIWMIIPFVPFGLRSLEQIG